MSSDTPRTDLAEGLVGESPLSEDEWPTFARQLERDLSACRQECEGLREVIDETFTAHIPDPLDERSEICECPACRFKRNSNFDRAGIGFHSSLSAEAKITDWEYILKPKEGEDARKLVTLKTAEGMVWVGIRYWNHDKQRWFNGNDPESATVIAWMNLREPAAKYWDRGQLVGDRP